MKIFSKINMKIRVFHKSIRVTVLFKANYFVFMKLLGFGLNVSTVNSFGIFKGVDVRKDNFKKDNFKRNTHAVFRLFLFLSLCFLFTTICYSQYSQSELIAPQCIYISEIMYNPTGDDNLLEFVEICNICNSSVSLKGVVLNGVSYAFADDSVIGSKDFVIVSKSCYNQGDFCSQHPELVDKTFCCFSGVLTNTFKTLELSYNSLVFDSFSYVGASKENYSAQRFSNKTEFSMPYGTPGVCYITPPFLDLSDQDNGGFANESVTNGSVANESTGDEGLVNESAGNDYLVNESNNNESSNNYGNASNQDNQTNSSEINNESETDTNQSGQNLTNQSFGNDNQTAQNLTNQSQNTANQTNQSNTNLTEQNQLNQSNQSNQSNESNQSCLDGWIYIYAPLIINESSTNYTLTLNAPKGCSYYYEYEVLDLCGNIVRSLRESTSFGKKSFTPSTNCCAYQINAYLYENSERILVNNSTSYMIKPSSCAVDKQTERFVDFSRSNNNIRFGFYVEEPLSVKEQIEKISFSIKVKKASSKTLQNFLKGTLNVTSDYSYFVSEFDEDVICKNFQGASSVFLSGKINKEEFEEEIEINCSKEAELSINTSANGDKNSSDTIKNISNQTNSKLSAVNELLRSIFQIKSFYTLKKNFSDNISLFFNTEFNESVLGDLYGYILEEPFKISPGKNELVFPFKKGSGKLYLLVFNASEVFGIKELNYSFSGFKGIDDVQEINDAQKNIDDLKSESLSKFSGLLLGIPNNSLDLNDGLVNGVNSSVLKSKDKNNTSDTSLISGKVVLSKNLKSNDLFLGILGIGTFSGLSYGLYRFTKK